MSAIPTSFDFGGVAIRPDYVLKVSYGNDSIALIQWAHEYNLKHPLGKVVCLYNNTGWGASWWGGRVENAERNLVEKYGFIPCHTNALDWRRLLREHNTWPDRLRRFCTVQQKVLPALAWLSQHDPDGRAELVCGVRRDESHARRNWPEWVDSDSTNEGRAQWSPLVEMNPEERDALIVRAGWVPLEHRSRECRCVLANAKDISTWSEEDLAQIESEETALGELNRGREFSNKYMFHPHRKAGNPQGIREVVEWAKRAVKKAEDLRAKKDRTKYEQVALDALESETLTGASGCDSGYCTG